MILLLLLPDSSDSDSDSNSNPSMAAQVLATVVNVVTLLSVERVVDVDVNDLCSHYYYYCFQHL